MGKQLSLPRLFGGADQLQLQLAAQTCTQVCVV